MKKSNFDVVTKDEMRFYRRSQIEKYLQMGFTSLKFIKYWTRTKEVNVYGLELRRYYYYEYHH